MKKIILSIFTLLILLLNIGCNYDFDTDISSSTPEKGSADFSTYVALGNSLTAGYRDGALYRDGQLESYPSIIAEQMKKVGGGTFVQPMIDNNVGGFKTLFFLSGETMFHGKLTLSSELIPVSSNPAGDLDYIGGPGKYFNNMGVPGAKVIHLLKEGYGEVMQNPYYSRFTTGLSSSIVKDALAQNPTFVSLWIGNNDVLGYATSGGDGTNPVTPVEGSVGVGFASTYNHLIDQLFPTGTDRKGVLANIPYVTSIPFFTTIPHNPLMASNLGEGSITDGEIQIDYLNTYLYGPLKEVLNTYGEGDRINLVSKKERNPLLLKDKNLKSFHIEIREALIRDKAMDIQTATAIGLIFGQARQATPDDLILLTTKKVIGKEPNTRRFPNIQLPLNKYGITYPLDDQHVLTKDEVNELKAVTDDYNRIIRSVAKAKGLAFVDINAKMSELNSASGIVFNGVKYSVTFASGGVFSLDGIHPTGRGAAILANEFIKAINSKYRSTLPQVNVNEYTGITFP